MPYSCQSECTAVSGMVIRKSARMTLKKSREQGTEAIFSCRNWTEAAPTYFRVGGYLFGNFSP